MDLAAREDTNTIFNPPTRVMDQVSAASYGRCLSGRCSRCYTSPTTSQKRTRRARLAKSLRMALPAVSTPSTYTSTGCMFRPTAIATAPALEERSWLGGQLVI